VFKSSAKSGAFFLRENDPILKEGFVMKDIFSGRFINETLIEIKNIMKKNYDGKSDEKYKNNQCS
jgi:hypothetical protein